jgi:hypothetical protein
VAVQSFPAGSSAGFDRLLASADVSQEQAHIGKWRRIKCGLDTLLLVGTGRARAAYHVVVTVRLCPTLYIHGVILQERDDYNLIRNEH